MPDEMVDKGVEITQRIWGRSRSERMQRSLEELGPPGFGDYVNRVFALYDRPTLDLKTRSLCQVAALTAMGQEAELKIHLRGALNNGATPEEAHEVIFQMAPYCGLPKVIHALQVARQVFNGHQVPEDRP